MQAGSVVKNEISFAVMISLMQKMICRYHTSFNNNLQNSPQKYLALFCCAVHYGIYKVCNNKVRAGTIFPP
jgi:hypothetical protein